MHLAQGLFGGLLYPWCPATQAAHAGHVITPTFFPDIQCLGSLRGFCISQTSLRVYRFPGI